MTTRRIHIDEYEMNVDKLEGIVNNPKCFRKAVVRLAKKTLKMMVGSDTCFGGRWAWVPEDAYQNLYYIN